VSYHALVFSFFANTAIDDSARPLAITMLPLTGHFTHHFIHQFTYQIISIKRPSATNSPFCSRRFPRNITIIIIIIISHLSNSSNKEGQQPQQQQPQQ
jgi:hypothetical protein